MKVFLLTLFYLTFANASNVDGIYGNWTVFNLDKGGEKQECYMAIFPKKIIGNYEKKSEPYILITRFKEYNTEEVSVYSGYEYKKNSDLYMSIDGEQFQLFTKDDMAWNSDSTKDKKMIQKILLSKEIKTRGESGDGKYSVNIYSNSEAHNAYRRIKELCN